MNIEVLNHRLLKNLPSGSGIAKSGEVYYVVGDDAPFLFTLNKEFDVVSKISLLDNAHVFEERIIKSQKPDFECLEMVGKDELVVFGSGSRSPERDVFIRILFKDPVIIERYSTTDLYNNLRALPIFSNSELNIEATAFSNNKIYFFNRKKNLMIEFVYHDLLGYVRGELPFPSPQLTEIKLPCIKGVEAGFSGATALINQAKIIFTASVEDTDNAYDDGEIFGSIIGMIDISETNGPTLLGYCEIPKIETTLKVESVTVEEEISVGKTKVILITDDDLGNSMILESLLIY